MEKRLKRDEEMERHRRDNELVEECQKHAEMFSMLTKLMAESSRRWDSAVTSRRDEADASNREGQYRGLSHNV